MAQHHGTEGTVKIGSDAVGELTSWNINESSETIQTNQPTIGTPNPDLTFTGGAKSWTGSATAMWDEGDTGQNALTNGATGTLNVYPEGDTSGDTYFNGSILVTSIDRTGSTDGMVEVTFSFQGSGALSESTVV